MDNSPIGKLPKELRDQVTEYVMNFDYVVLLNHEDLGHRFDPEEESCLLRPSKIRCDWWRRPLSPPCDQLERRPAQDLRQLLNGWPTVCKQARVESKTLFFSLNEFDFDCCPIEDAHNYDATVYAEKGLRNLHKTFDLFGTTDVGTIRTAHIGLGAWSDLNQPRSIVDTVWASLWAAKDRIHPTGQITISFTIDYPEEYEENIHFFVRLEDEASVQCELHRRASRFRFEPGFLAWISPSESKAFEKLMREFLRGTKISENFVQEALTVSIESA